MVFVFGCQGGIEYFNMLPDYLQPGSCFSKAAEVTFSDRDAAAIWSFLIFLLLPEIEHPDDGFIKEFIQLLDLFL